MPAASQLHPRTLCGDSEVRRECRLPPRVSSYEMGVTVTTEPVTSAALRIRGEGLACHRLQGIGILVVLRAQ